MRIHPNHRDAEKCTSYVDSISGNIKGEKNGIPTTKVHWIFEGGPITYHVEDYKNTSYKKVVMGLIGSIAISDN